MTREGRKITPVIVFGESFARTIIFLLGGIQDVKNKITLCQRHIILVVTRGFPAGPRWLADDTYYAPLVA